MAKKKVKKAARKTAKKTTKPAPRKKKSTGLAVVALIINVLLLPGLGTLVFGRRIKEGIWQVVIAVAGFLLWNTFIGFPALAIAWIWGLVSGVQLIQESRQ